MMNTVVKDEPPSRGPVPTEEKPTNLDLHTAPTMPKQPHPQLYVIPKREPQQQLPQFQEQKPCPDLEYEYHFYQEEEEEEMSDGAENFNEDEDNNEAPDEPEDETEEPTTKRQKKSQDVFTRDETLHIFKFLLGQITSRSEGRVGHVAKRRVELSTLDLWAKYKIMYGLRREPAAYRTNFRLHVGGLHNFSGLTLEEKADLYYGLDVKVAKAFRPKLAKLFGVKFDDQGIITGSSMFPHWDLVHPDTDREDEIQVRMRKNKHWNRFTEHDDGIMWEYVVDYIQTSDIIQINGMKAWSDFKKRYKSRGVNQKRSAETYRGRYNRILVPNLHKMPFDTCTKAAIYETFQYVVPEEYRQTLIEETGVVIDDEGRISQYKDRPKSFVLQTKTYENLIGITSSIKTSSLRYPHSGVQDHVPYTTEENHLIWRFINSSIRDHNGKPMRSSKKVTGWLFWKEFMQKTGSERTWQSLSNHFSTKLLDTLLDTNFDMRTKIELYFSLQIPVEENVVHLFEEMTTKLVLKDNRRIRYATGKDKLGNIFEVGRRKWPAQPMPSIRQRVRNEPDLSSEDEEDQYVKAGFNRGHHEEEYDDMDFNSFRPYQPPPQYSHAPTYGMNPYGKPPQQKLLRNRFGMFVSPNPVPLVPSTVKPVLPKVSAATASRPILAVTPFSARPGVNNSKSFPYMPLRKECRTNVPLGNINEEQTAPFSAQRNSEECEIVGSDAVSLQEVKKEVDFDDCDERSDPIPSNTAMNTDHMDNDGRMLKELKADPICLPSVGIETPTTIARPMEEAKPVKISVAPSTNPNYQKLAAHFEAFRNTICGRPAQVLINRKTNPEDSSQHSQSPCPEGSPMTWQQQEPERQQKTRKRSRAMYQPEDSAIDPRAHEDSTMAVETAFEGLERSIKNFCGRLKRDSTRLTREESDGYALRVMNIAKKFKTDAKRELVKKNRRSQPQ